MSDVTTRLVLTEDVSNKLQRIITYARQTVTAMSSAGRSIDSAFDTSIPDEFASSTGEAIRDISSEAESLGDAINSIFDDLDTGDFSDGLSDAFRDAARDADSFAEAAAGAEENMEGLSSAAAEAGANAGELGGAGGLDEFAEEANNAGRALDDAGSSALNLKGILVGLVSAVSLAAIGNQVGDFVKSSVEIGRGFSSTMSEVKAISGATGAEFEKLEATARQYGATTVFSASEAGEALKYMSLAGWDANQSSAALGGVLNLAAASGMELGQSSDMVTDYLSAFGMKASESAYFADMLAFAQSNSNTTAEQLGEAYRNSAANLHAAGQDVETTTSLLEAMANQGYKGSEAGTALAAVMRDITQKMDDGAIKIGDTSIAVQDAQGNFRDLTDILTEVESATSGMGDAEKAEALASTFTADSIKAMNMILTEGMDKVSGYEDALRHAGGTAEAMADTMNDNLSGDLANMNSAFEELQLQVYDGMEEPLRSAVQTITGDVIPTLTEWVPQAISGAIQTLSNVGSALMPLINTVLKNPGAVAAAFGSIGAGMIAFKGIGVASNIASTIENVGGLTGALGKLSGIMTNNAWGIGAAAIAAGVVAVGAAVEKYNEIQVNTSLTEHFGSIELDDSQIQDFASRVIDAEYIVNINAALGHFENADALAQEAEAALQENDALEWKCRVGISLTPDEQETYSANIQEFAQSKVDELEERTYAVELTVSTMLKSPEGESLAAQISQWAAEDMADVSLLQGQITNLVQTALEDGIIDVNEQAAIDMLQTKINSILSGWKSSEAEAEMDLIEQQYGRLSGKDLTSETFTSIVDALGQQRQSAAEALEADSKEFYGVINGLVNSGRLTEGQGEDYKEQFVQAARNQEAGSLVNSLNFEGNTIQDTYGEKLDENFSAMQESTGKFLERANDYLANEDYSSLSDSMMGAFNSAMTGTGLFSSKDQKALSKLYDTMKPDVNAMGELIDEYRAMGQAVPEDVMTAFNEAISVGAAAGDVDAAWQQFANELVADPASQALEQGILDGTVGVPDELRTAVERAATETTSEPVTIDSMAAELENIEVDDGKVQELLAQSLEGLEAVGTTTINGTAVVEYEVTAGQTLSEIAEQAGIKLEELLAVNPDITNPDVIEIGQKVNIPASAVEVDSSGVGEAVQEETKAATEGADAATETTTNVKVTAGEVDSSEAVSSTQEETDTAFSTTFETQGSTNVTLDQTNNSAAVYSEVGSDLTSAFSAGYNISGRAHVTINVDYSIANPSATISIGGDGSGSGTVTASIAGHAEGGYFDSPHMAMIAEGGYGEWIIPNDGSSKAKELWESAGETLGLIDGPIGVSPDGFSSGKGSGSGGDGSGARDSKDINLNINGSGRMQVSSNMSKEAILEIIQDNIRGVLLDIIDQEILEEGDGAYDW